MRKCEFKIMCIVVMLYTVIFSGCISEKANVSTNLFDVRNNGEYIQWKMVVVIVGMIWLRLMI